MEKIIEIALGVEGYGYPSGCVGRITVDERAYVSNDELSLQIVQLDSKPACWRAWSGRR